MPASAGKGTEPATLITPSRKRQFLRRHRQGTERRPARRQRPRQADETPQRRIVVTRQLDGAVRDQILLRCRERPEDNLWIAGRGPGFADEADAKTKGDQMHQGLAADANTLDRWAVSEIGQLPNDKVMDFRARRVPTDDEVLALQLLPTDMVGVSEAMLFRDIAVSAQSAAEGTTVVSSSISRVATEATEMLDCSWHIAAWTDLLGERQVP